MTMVALMLSLIVLMYYVMNAKSLTLDLIPPTVTEMMYQLARRHSFGIDQVRGISFFIFYSNNQI